MLTFKQILKIWKDKAGYVLCYNPAHGYRKLVTIDGKENIARFVHCPLIQFYPKPTYLYHTKRSFIFSSIKYFKEKKWI